MFGIWNKNGGWAWGQDLENRAAWKSNRDIREDISRVFRYFDKNNIGIRVIKAASEVREMAKNE